MALVSSLNIRMNGGLVSSDFVHISYYYKFKLIDPYHWAFLQQAKIPFSDNVKNLLLPQLSDMNFIQDLCNDLCELFRVCISFSPLSLYLF